MCTDVCMAQNKVKGRFVSVCMVTWASRRNGENWMDAVSYVSRLEATICYKGSIGYLSNFANWNKKLPLWSGCFSNLGCQLRRNSKIN